VITNFEFNAIQTEIIHIQNKKLKYNAQTNNKTHKEGKRERIGREEGGKETK
jgi:hypothetical protein